MTTSGVYSFSVSRDDIIRQAMLNIKRLDPDETPTATETNDCARVLNMMCKQWMGKSDFAPGLKVWTRKRGVLLLSNSTGILTIGPTAQGWSNSMAVTTLAATAAGGSTSLSVASATGFTTGYTLAVELDSGSLQYLTISGVAGTTITVPALNSQASSGNAVYCYQTAAQKPRKIETALLRDEFNTDTPLNIMTVQTYDQLPNKTDPNNVGDPTAIYVEEGLTTTTIYTDVGACQDVSKYIVLTYLEPVQDFTTTTDTPYYPQEWYLALCWGLTEQIAPMFSAMWTDKMESLKNTAIAIARNHSAEISDLYFQPGNDG